MAQYLYGTVVSTAQVYLMLHRSSMENSH